MPLFGPWVQPADVVLPITTTWHRRGWTGFLRHSDMPGSTIGSIFDALMAQTPEVSLFDSPGAPSYAPAHDRIQLNFQTFDVGTVYAGDLAGAWTNGSSHYTSQALTVANVGQVPSSPRVAPASVPLNATVEYDDPGVWSGPNQVAVTWSVRVMGLPVISASADLMAAGGGLPDYAAVAAMPVVATKSVPGESDYNMTTALHEAGTVTTAFEMLSTPFSLAVRSTLRDGLAPPVGTEGFGFAAGGAAIYGVAVRRLYTPPRYRFVYDRAPYTIEAGQGAGDAARFHEGGRYGL